MSDKQKLAAISDIMELAARKVKEYVREGFSTDLHERISLQELKEIRRLAKVKGRK